MSAGDKLTWYGKSEALSSADEAISDVTHYVPETNPLRAMILTQLVAARALINALETEEDW